MEARQKPRPLRQRHSFDRIKIVFRSELALYTLAFFCLNLSFAQIEASYVLLLRDYLGFGAGKTGWLFAYIGICIILVQSVLINMARRFGEVGTVAFGAVCCLSAYGADFVGLHGGR